MNSDALVLALVAIADFAFIVYLRRRRHRRLRQERMMESLGLAVRRFNTADGSLGKAAIAVRQLV